MGAAVYPSGITEELSEKADITVLDADAIAISVGNARTMNIVLLGTAVKALTAVDPDLADVDWERVVRAGVKPAVADVNVAAFKAGIA
jgi:indolepyruvate ferredoxin oxidoreductase beta subunit